MSRNLLLAAAIAVAAAVIPAPASAAAASLPGADQIVVRKLANGMTIVVWPDHDIPNVALYTWYRVGSRNEHAGITGISHLLEHMMFKGTPRHDKIWTLLQNRGANFNGTTAWDRTNYYETLPASGDNLEFALALEADRMVNSKIAAEDLATEFSVVRNEFEMGENNPQGVLEERMLSTAVCEATSPKACPPTPSAKTKSQPCVRASWGVAATT